MKRDQRPIWFKGLALFAASLLVVGGMLASVTPSGVYNALPLVGGARACDIRGGGLLECSEAVGAR